MFPFCSMAFPAKPRAKRLTERIAMAHKSPESLHWSLPISPIGPWLPLPMLQICTLWCNGKPPRQKSIDDHSKWNHFQEPSKLVHTSIGRGETVSSWCKAAELPGFGTSLCREFLVEARLQKGLIGRGRHQKLVLTLDQQTRPIVDGQNPAPVGNHGQTTVCWNLQGNHPSRAS